MLPRCSAAPGGVEGDRPEEGEIQEVSTGRRADMQETTGPADSVLLADVHANGGDGRAGDSGTDLGISVEHGAALGLFARGDAAKLRAAVRDTCGALGWSWLTPGDTVFLKVSSNSPNPHPAVTSPEAVRAVCEELFSRGAGKVMAGDQSGIEFVRLAAGDKLWGSTKQVMKENGLLAAIEGSGAVPYALEEHGYESGYFAAGLPLSDSHWASGPYMAAIIKEVDHVITLPRMSSHVIAGCSLGHKCAIGWLRDDSRYLLHFEGASIHEKVAELSFATELREKHRLVITLADYGLFDSGPDKGTVAPLDPVAVIASPVVADHDALAVAIMAWFDAHTAVDSQLPVVYSAEDADAVNQLLLKVLVPAKYGEPWGPGDMADYAPVPFHAYQEGVSSNLVLARSFALLGGVPAALPVKLVGKAPDEDLRSFLEAFDNGFLKLEVGT